MNNFINLLVVYLSIFVFRKIYEPVDQNYNNFPNLYDNSSNEYFKSLCLKNQSEYETTIKNDFLNNTTMLLLNHISNSYILLDFGRIGCNDQNKIDFIKNNYLYNVNHEIKSKNIVYQIIYYALYFMNTIFGLIYFILTIPSLIFVKILN